MKLRYPALLLGLALGSACSQGEPPASASPSAGKSPSATSQAASAQAGPAGAPAPSATEAAKPEIPALKVEAFDGSTFELAAHRGKWVVVNFWATWCNPCLKEIPDLNALDSAREDVVVVGLAYEEIDRADMEAFLKQHPISYPIAIIDVYAPPADFDTPRGLPMTYLISPDGKVAKKSLGPVTSAELALVIDAGAPAAVPAGT